MTAPNTNHRRSRWRGTNACLLWFVCGLCALPGRDQAEEVPLREYAIKAALLYNVAKYIDWPVTAFSQPDDPIVIGVLGDDPFGETLDRVVQGRVVNGHPIAVRRASGVSELRGAHVVFISPTEARAAEVCVVLESFRVLTVSDTLQSAAFVAVNFAVEGDKIAFAVDLERVSRTGVQISSKLLNFAKAVKRPGDSIPR
jgi:hypothetical protein